MWRALFLAGLTCSLVMADDGPPIAITSPDHAQTFTFGSERHREWIVRGDHLGVIMHFTNDPYVTQTEPRRYDDFSFDFPTIIRKGDIFYYRPPGHRHPVAVATVHPGLFGDDVRLLPSSLLVVDKVHGFLTLTLIVGRETGEK